MVKTTYILHGESNKLELKNTIGKASINTIKVYLPKIKYY
jgi:hypothetical protein